MKVTTATTAKVNLHGLDPGPKGKVRRCMESRI